MAKKSTSKNKTKKRPAAGSSKSMARQPQPQATAPAWFESGMGFVLRFQRFAGDVIGICLLAVASMTLFALIGLTSGAWLTPWASLLQRWLGFGSIFVVIAFGLGGLLLMRHRQNEFSGKDWGRVISLELAAFAAISLLSIFGGVSLERAELGKDGGLVGWGIAEFMGILLSSFPELLSDILRVSFLLIVLVLGVLFGLGLVGQALRRLEAILEGQPAGVNDFAASPAVSVGEMAAPAPSQPEVAGTKKRSTYIPPQHRKKFKVEEQEDALASGLAGRDERLPNLEFLATGKEIKPNERHINQTAGLIEKTLAEFGIPAKVVGFKVGPTVTQFAVEPGYNQRLGAEGEDGRQKVRVSQIAGLQRDLALALSAERLRIQAPVPGRQYVGIEVPNKRSSVVRLRPILETEAFHKLNSPLAIALGRDVSGHSVVANLSDMPHLLIAGTTGSGKSVCIAALTVCLAMNNTPDDLRLVMIDPKMVELVRFNGLPHLYGKVETNLERINGVLRWVVAEMGRRYKLLEELRARDIESYNRKVRRRKEYETLPRIVVMIDELADLMMSAAEQTETTLVRLAQMARATGIHLVVATQRPSTDVVTGLIKANFPARLSFAVASGIDSRVILDSSGAETLLGRGDMLFLSPEGGAPMRAQGVLVTDQEIESMITYWRKNWGQEDEEEDQSPWDAMIERTSVLSDRDDLTERAIDLIRDTGKASASMMQRRLRVGYPRAARLMDELEDMGIVGPTRGGGREREILIDLDKYENDE